MNEPDLPAFPWGPRDYRRFANWLSVGIHLYLYLGMIVLLYLVNGQTWILGWKPAAITLVSGVLLARLWYRWMMQLDARYGSGRGWELWSRRVKLPERAERPGAGPT